MANRHSIAVSDILPMEDYAKQRIEIRRANMLRKRDRRVDVGPYVTFYFENYHTMWAQVHEMLHIEKGGPAQIPEEIAAYNPLIPQGAELIATFMIEIADENRRRETLGKLGGIEHSSFITVGGETIKGASEEDAERTTEDGKASSVQFVHFRFTPAQIAAFRMKDAKVVLGFSHANYGHMTFLTEATRAELAGDFD